MADRIGQQLGNYRLTRLLGQGGFAEVYLGEHMYLKTQAAVKVLSTQLAREDFEDFQAEARTVANLEHPHIVRVLEFGIEGAMPFLVMSYAPNGSLRQQHPRGTPLPLPLILQYVRQVADALQYAHDEKLIHRDIKPENMLLGRRKEVLLSDFGIAIISQTSRSKSVQEVIGTVAYMSPEMLQGKPKAASDQYALGIVVYEWLCGQRPFQGGFTELASQHMFVPPPSLREKNPTISPDLEQVVMTALAKEPQQRFSSVHAFAHALQQAGQSAAYQPTVYAPPAQPFQPTQPATPPNSPRQPAVPPAQNQFPQPLAGTATPSQAISSPMLNTPSSPSKQFSGPTALSSDPSSQPDLLTPPSSQSLQPTVAAASSNSSSQPSSTLPPTVQAAPAIAAPTNLKTPTAKTLEPTVAVPPPAQTPPSTQSKRLRSPAATVSLILLALILLGGISFGIYRGVTWSPPSGTSQNLNGVVWSGSQFVVVGDGDTILTSPDGHTWTPQPSGTSNTFLHGVVWSGSQFVAVGDTILTSPDGRTWTPQTSVAPNYLNGVAWSGSQFVAVGFHGTIFTSPDGHTWTPQPSGTSQILNGLAWSGSQFVVVGEGGTILTSPDGRTWTPQTSGISDALLQGVVWSGSQFVVVGDEGDSPILTSPDGRTWTPQPSGPGLHGVAWSGSQFVAVGWDSPIFTSPDGHTWTPQTSGTSNELFSVAWSGSQFVAVGDHGTIFTSPDGRTWTT